MIFTTNFHILQNMKAERKENLLFAKSVVKFLIISEIICCMRKAYDSDLAVCVEYLFF